MKIKLKVLTPVHIGSGQKISPIEYIVEKNTFVRIDMSGLFNDQKFKPLKEKFINSAQTERYIGNLLPRDLLLKHPLYSIDISTSARNSNPIEVKEFIKSAGRVYIPGSSLKGSLLSAVIYMVKKQENIKDLSRYYKEDILKDVLNKVSDVKSGRFSHWLDIRDSNFKTSEESLEISQTKLVGARSGREMPIFYETLKENIEFETEIISKCKQSEEEILKMSDSFYRKIYEKEKEFFKQDFLKPSKNSFLLRMGQGSTAWATSFLILSEELGIKNYPIHRPKTKKLISGTKSMGWMEVIYG